MKIQIKAVQLRIKVVISMMIFTIELINVYKTYLWNSKTNKTANLYILKYNMKMIVKRSKQKINQQHGSQKITLMGSASKIQKKDQLLIILNMSSTSATKTIIWLFTIVILIVQNLLMPKKNFNTVVMTNLKNISAHSGLLE